MPNVSRRGLLKAAELDAPRALARWLERHGPALGDIIEHGTWLAREDVDSMLGLPVPGVGELLGLIEIAAMAAPEGSSGRAYDLVVVDTAPTGHTLRLLAAPETVAAAAAALAALRREPRLIRERLVGDASPEAADRLIDLLEGQARDTAELLRDPARTAISWVTLPEELSLAESADALRALDAAGLPVTEVIVNRVLPAGPPCPVCDRRRAEERRVLARAARTIGRRHPLRIVPAVTGEPRGAAALAPIGRRLAAPPLAVRVPIARVRSALPPPAMSALDRRGGVMATELAALGGLRLLFFGGKGGVGKTTAAAAVALQVARADPRRRLLLLSTDPAHSLGDIFGATLGDRPVRVGGAPPNLEVREIDAVRAMAARRERLDAALAEIVGAEGASSVRGLGELIDLAPPGIDELFGFVSILEIASPGGGRRPARGSSSPGGGRAASAAAYDRVVVDTAPTGHALRLLEMPDVAREWTRVLMRVLLKYRDLMRPGPLAAELVALSRETRALQALMQDARRSGFVVVTRAAEVPRLETGRLLARLRRLRISVPAVIVNARTLAPGRCPVCRATARAEDAQVARIRRVCHDCVIIQTPLAAPPPRGVASLDRWARGWIR